MLTIQYVALKFKTFNELNLVLMACSLGDINKWKQKGKGCYFLGKINQDVFLIIRYLIVCSHINR